MTADQPAPEGREPVLKLHGEEFAVVQPPLWATMRMLAGYNSGDDGRALGAVYEFLRVLIDPADWPRFEAHAASVDATFSDFDRAIGEAMAALAGRGNASPGSSSPSSDGSPTPETPPTSRVVSLSQGIEANPEGLSSTG